MIADPTPDRDRRFYTFYRDAEGRTYISSMLLLYILKWQQDVANHQSLMKKRARDARYRARRRGAA